MSHPKVCAGAPYMPTLEELYERAERIRRSWSDAELRAKLGLTPATRLRSSEESYEEDDEDWE